MPDMPDSFARTLARHGLGRAPIPLGDYSLGPGAILDGGGEAVAVDTTAMWAAVAWECATHVCAALSAAFPDTRAAFVHDGEGVQAVPSAEPVWLGALRALCALKASGGGDHAAALAVLAYARAARDASASGDRTSDPDWRVSSFVADAYPCRPPSHLPGARDLECAALPRAA